MSKDHDTKSEPNYFALIYVGYLNRCIPEKEDAEEGAIYLSSKYGELMKFVDGEYVDLEKPYSYYFYDELTAILYLIDTEKAKITCPKCVHDVLFNCEDQKLYKSEYQKCGKKQVLVEICDFELPEAVGTTGDQPQIQGGINDYKALRGWTEVPTQEGTWPSTERGVGNYTIPESGEYSVQATITWDNYPIGKGNNNDNDLFDLAGTGQLGVSPSLVLQKKKDFLSWDDLQNEFFGLNSLSSYNGGEQDTPIQIFPKSGTISLHTVRKFQKGDILRLALAKGGTVKWVTQLDANIDLFKYKGSVLSIKKVAK